MADNYREKRMEEYRAGRLAPRTRVVARGGVVRREKGEFVVEFPQMRVVVLGGGIGLAEAVAKAFRTVDCQVALCHADSRSLTPFAQRHGLRYYPFDAAEKWERVIDDVTARWGGVDVVVDLRECSDEVALEVRSDAFSRNKPSESVVAVEAPTTDDCNSLRDMTEDELANFAELLMLHAHPKFGFVQSVDVRFEE